MTPVGTRRQPREGSGTRLDGIDGLRALAIFFVLMNHVNMRLVLAKIPYAKALPRQLVSSLVWNGQYGVQIFFAVSGFLITSLTLRRCLLITVAAQTRWRAPRLLAPVLGLGQRSYEVYLTHMFVVFGLFHLFIASGSPMRAVPALFALVIVLSALAGEVVARYCSEPMNQWLRRRWGAQELGSITEVPEGR